MRPNNNEDNIDRKCAFLSVILGYTCSGDQGSLGHMQFIKTLIDGIFALCRIESRIVFIYVVKTGFIRKLKLNVDS